MCVCVCVCVCVHILFFCEEVLIFAKELNGLTY